MSARSKSSRKLGDLRVFAATVIAGRHSSPPRAENSALCCGPCLRPFYAAVPACRGKLAGVDESLSINLDFDAAAKLWDAYAAAFPVQAAAAGTYNVEAFGDSPAQADELLALVLDGSKRATSSHVAAYADEGEPLPRIGVHWIVCDGAGVPRVILRTTELRLGTFNDADEALARDEGEDDLSLDSWRREHRRFWERTAAARGGRWSESDELVFERFEVVWPAQ